MRAEEFPYSTELLHRHVAPFAPELHEGAVGTGIYLLIERVYFFFCFRVALIRARALGICRAYLVGCCRFADAIFTESPKRLRHIWSDIAAERIASDFCAGIFYESRYCFTDNSANQVAHMHFFKRIRVRIFNDGALPVLCSSFSPL